MGVECRLDLLIGNFCERVDPKDLKMKMLDTLRTLLTITLLTFLIQSQFISSSHAEDGITILYDSFGQQSDMKKDWGFSALIEYQGKRILFDTGDNADIFAHNVKAKGIDLTKLDFAIISHRHGDHIGGIPYLLAVNPNIKIYAPKENFGIFGSTLPGSFYRRDDTLPKERRYFDGKAPETMTFGDAWNKKFELVDKTTEVAPGLFLISLISTNTGTLELHELSLAIKTPNGLVIVVGCSHPGIEKIVAAAAAINPHIHLILGGMHLVVTPDQEIQRISIALRDTWKVDYIAPGHCTGEPAFALLAKDFGERYVYAGLGQTLSFDNEVSTSVKKDAQGFEMLSPQEKVSYKAFVNAEIAENE